MSYFIPEEKALRGFSCLAHPDRLRVIRMLVVAGAEGMSAGDIAKALGDAPPSRVSFHLKELESAELIQRKRAGKSLIYSARFPSLSDLVAFLMHDCCEGHCTYCDDAIALFAKCEGRPTNSADDK